MAEEKTITVTLESGGHLPNPITTQPGQPGFANYPPPQQGYGIQPVVNPPPGGYGISTHDGNPQGGFQGGYGPGVPQGGYGPGTPPAVPQGGYGPGIRTAPAVPPGTQPAIPQGGYGPGIRPAVPPGTQPAIPQGGYGVPPQQGYGQPQGAFGPPQTNFGTNGPSNDNWMMRPQNIPNCPPGLEYLTTIDTLIVNQILNMGEVLADREPENEFVVTNSIGQKIYYAKEESDDCSRRFCCSKRAFRMKVFDNFGNQVADLSRPIACQACCFPCCLQKVEISAPPGTVVGRIEQEWAILHPTFSVKGPTGDTILKIQGPWCTMNCYADVDFKVLTSDGVSEVGKISKRWSGYANENAAKMDVFGISFPVDLDLRMKAVMLGACFLIDMMYFEQRVTNPNKTNPARSNPQQQQELKPI